MDCCDFCLSRRAGIERTLACARIYRAENIALLRTYNVPPDHYAVRSTYTHLLSLGTASYSPAHAFTHCRCCRTALPVPFRSPHVFTSPVLYSAHAAFWFCSTALRALLTWFRAHYLVTLPLILPPPHRLTAAPGHHLPAAPPFALRFARHLFHP